MAELAESSGAQGPQPVNTALDSELGTQFAKTVVLDERRAQSASTVLDDEDDADTVLDDEDADTPIEEGDSDVELVVVSMGVEAERARMEHEFKMACGMRLLHQQIEIEKKIRGVFSKPPLSMDERERIRKLLN